MDKKIKVIIATGSLGGPATYSRVLKEKLPERGYEIKVINFGDVLKYPKIIRHVIYFSKLLIESRGADIIYAQDPISTGLPARLAAKISSKRFFLKIVGDYAWEQAIQRFGVKDLLDDFVKDNNYSFPVNILKSLQIWVARGAEKIIVPSNYLKDIVGKWGIDPNKIVVIYNAFIEPKILESKIELAKKNNFSFPTIISVGRLVSWKGFDNLIEALPLVKENFRAVKLQILGEGPEKENLEQLVNNLGLMDNVVFLGQRPQSEMYELIKAADVFALVSSYEGFSHVLIETMAIGTPIVTTPVGGNIEVVDDGENALFVPYDNPVETAKALITILNNEKLSQELIDNGQISAKNFTQEKMLAKLTTILR